MNVLICPHTHAQLNPRMISFVTYNMTNCRKRHIHCSLSLARLKSTEDIIANRDYQFVVFSLLRACALA